MTTWRDLSDQLTETQVGYLEWLERDPPGGLLAKPEQHLMLARGWASENLEQSLYADVPPPEGAAEVGEWRMSKADVRCRDYTVAGTIADVGVTLEIRGSQYTDGHVEGRLAVTGDGLGQLTPAGARELAEALLAAAERLRGR